MNVQLRTVNRVQTAEPVAVDVTTSRWGGVLDGDKIEYCRRNGIALAYDPAQAGWIAMDCPDAFDSAALPGASVSKVQVEDRLLPPLRIRCIELERRYDLRAWTEADVGTFVSLLDNPNIWRHVPEDYPAPLTEELAREMISLSNVAAHHDVRAVIVDGRIVGQVSVLHGRADATDAEISYWLGEEFWGEGYGKDVAMLYCYMYFRKHPRVQSLFARIHEGNTASRRMIEKAHFTADGPDPADHDWLLYRIDRSMFWQN